MPEMFFTLPQVAGLWATIQGGVHSFMEFLFRGTQAVGIPSYALVIVLVTIIIKILMYPTTKKQAKQMVAMQRLLPLQNEIKERYKNNPERYQQEIARLYKKEGINPFSSCLPLLIQLPILLALYNILATFQPLHPEFAGLFGYDAMEFGLSTIVSDTPGIWGWVIPVMVAAAQFLQQYLSTSNKQDQTQKMMLFFMPILFGWFTRRFVVGLALYWFGYSVIGAVQQLFINKEVKKEREIYEARRAEEEAQKQERKRKKAEAKALAQGKNPAKPKAAQPEKPLTFIDEDGEEYEIDYEAITPYDRHPKKKKKVVVEEEDDLSDDMQDENQTEDQTENKEE